MGARGPQPTPTARLSQRGSWRAKERQNAGEPDVVTAVPECPAFLKGAARDEWRRVTPELLGRDTISHGDRAVIVVYCQSWRTFVEATEAIESAGMMVPTAKGGVTLNPMLDVQARAVEQLLKAADRLGLSPAAKARVRKYTNGEKQEETGLRGLRLA